MPGRIFAPDIIAGSMYPPTRQGRGGGPAKAGGFTDPLFDDFKKLHILS